MGILGQTINDFKNANLAKCINVPIGMDWPHVHFDLLKYEKRTAVLKSHYDGRIFRLKVVDRGEQQRAVLDQIRQLEVLPVAGQRV